MCTKISVHLASLNRPDAEAECSRIAFNKGLRVLRIERREKRKKVPKQSKDPCEPQDYTLVNTGECEFVGVFMAQIA